MMRVKDPVLRELLWNGFETIVGEMSSVLQRSAFSPMIREMLDFSCGFLDPRGRLIADSHLIPAQAGTLEFALQGALARFPEVSEGDVVVTNDPYSGATHLPDVEVFSPVFLDGVLLGYVATVAHHVDIGGLSARNRGNIGLAGSASRDLFEEGLQIPPVKLVDAGVPNAALWDMILRNVRDPASVKADLTAQISSCSRGAERIQELAQRYSREAFLDSCSDLIDDTSARAEALLRTWPGHTVTAAVDLDGDGLNYGQPLHVEAAVTVQDGRLLVDLSESSLETAGTFNVPWSSTYSSLYYALRCFLGPTIRQNHGYMKHVQAIAPEGSLFRPHRPAAVLSRHMPVQALTDAVFRALSELIPERAIAASHVSFPVLLARAVDPRNGRQKTLMDTVGGGGGARAHSSGDDGIDSYTSNCALIPAEVIEIEYPWRVRSSALIEGSGGAGRHPGGRAVSREYELLSDNASGRVSAEQRQQSHTPKGILGGENGEPADISIKRIGDGGWESLPFGVTTFTLARGDRIRLTAAGGGGLGESH
ncbi:hydantoinase B/oxoprolinase family protein [Microbacterium sp. A204]|uniref:hydantoinase B/oxoprolinase family protein n=1 Tax=Microbacterium sp. A204 TaxID=3457321 RepID=UPI003FD576ED